MEGSMADSFLIDDILISFKFWNLVFTTSIGVTRNAAIEPAMAPDINTFTDCGRCFDLENIFFKEAFPANKNIENGISLNNLNDYKKTVKEKSLIQRKQTLKALLEGHNTSLLSPIVG